jgi:hypothetical protein
MVGVTDDATPTSEKLYPDSPPVPLMAYSAVEQLNGRPRPGMLTGTTPPDCFRWTALPECGLLGLAGTIEAALAEPAGTTAARGSPAAKRVMTSRLSTDRRPGPGRRADARPALTGCRKAAPRGHGPSGTSMNPPIESPRYFPAQAVEHLDKRVLLWRFTRNPRSAA